MNVLLFIGAILSMSIVTECNVDSKLLKCLVCRATIKEIEENLGKIDPARQVEVGNYRLDAQGNAIHKKVPLAQSEVYISDLLDSICEKMSDYVRATYKSNGELTILNLMNSSGGMNPELSKVDIVQDGDLNKSLKYYCEGIVEEHEDSMIAMFRSKESNIKKKLCTDLTSLCSSDDFPYEEEEGEEEYDGTSEERDEL